MLPPSKATGKVQLRTSSEVEKALFPAGMKSYLEERGINLDVLEEDGERLLIESVRGGILDTS